MKKVIISVLIAGLMTTALVAVITTKAKKSGGINKVLKYVPKSAKDLTFIDIDKSKEILSLLGEGYKLTKVAKKIPVPTNRYINIYFKLNELGLNSEDYSSLCIFKYNDNYHTLVETDLAPTDMKKLMRTLASNVKEILKSYGLPEEILEEYKRTGELLAIQEYANTINFTQVTDGLLLVTVNNTSNAYIKELKSGQLNSFEKEKVPEFEMENLVSHTMHDKLTVHPSKINHKTIFAKYRILESANLTITHDPLTKKFMVNMSANEKSKKAQKAVSQEEPSIIEMLQMYGLDIQKVTYKSLIEDGVTTTKIALKGDVSIVQKYEAFSEAIEIKEPKSSSKTSSKATPESGLSIKQE